MEQNAQDAATPQGQDMGIAYEFTVRARRYYKKGVRENEHMQLLELVTVNDDETGQVRARIASDMVGGVVISDDKYQEQWVITASEFWNRYLEMREKLAEVDK